MLSILSPSFASLLEINDSRLLEFDIRPFQINKLSHDLKSIIPIPVKLRESRDHVAALQMADDSLNADNEEEQEHGCNYVTKPTFPCGFPL